MYYKRVDSACLKIVRNEAQGYPDIRNSKRIQESAHYADLRITFDQNEAQKCEHLQLHDSLSAQIRRRMDTRDGYVGK